MYNLDKTYLKTFLYSPLSKRSSRNLSVKTETTDTAEKAAPDRIRKLDFG